MKQWKILKYKFSTSFSKVQNRQKAVLYWSLGSFFANLELFAIMTMIKFHIVSIFPEVFPKYVNTSMLWRAQKMKKVKFLYYNPRDFSDNKHKKVDARPYGGGPGMVMTVQPILSAVEKIKRKIKGRAKLKILIMSPNGSQFRNSVAQNYAKKYTDIIFICGHYEGIDARLKKILRAEEISIGPYILTGGELPALVMADAITRQIPGVLGHELSLEEKRIAGQKIYTRPEVIEFGGKKYKVPKVLLSGDHKKIEKWRTKNRKFPHS